MCFSYFISFFDVYWFAVIVIAPVDIFSGAAGCPMIRV
jgi:hypothetical protein